MYIKFNSKTSITKTANIQNLSKEKFSTEKSQCLRNSRINKFEFVKAVSYRFKASI